MQGRKKFEPKLFVNYYLPDMIPNNNFYKVLKDKLDLSFVYKSTKNVYSHTGRPAIDPVVFFKMLLVGYLENCCSDRALERLFQLRLDLLFFIDHDINERVPDHSTICKTRQRIPTEVFEQVFNHILGLCVNSGMVGGKVQSIDTAYINANASLDRMIEVKMVDRMPSEYLEEIKKQDNDEDKDNIRKKMEKAQKDLEFHKARRENKFKDTSTLKKNKKNTKRFLSNATHVSRTDPDARIAKKSSKPRMLCYSSAMSTDGKENVITHISAEYASKHDSRLLLDVTESTMGRLESMGLHMKKVLADTGFCSGYNYYVLKHWGLDAYIPIHGTYKSKREGFTYDEEKDQYMCENGKILHFTSVANRNGYDVKNYYSSKMDCRNCPISKGCINTKGNKHLQHTIYREEYEEMRQKLKTKKGKKKYAKRMQSVEPVFGSLQQYYGLRWINVRGKPSAHKVMLMSGAAFNLKKWLKKAIYCKNIVWQWVKAEIAECIISSELILGKFTINMIHEKLL